MSSEDEISRQLKKMQESQRELQLALGQVDRGMVGLGLGKPCAWCHNEYVDSYGTTAYPQYYGFCSTACINKYRRNTGQPDFDAGSVNHSQSSVSTSAEYSSPSQQIPTHRRVAQTAVSTGARMSGVKGVLLGIFLTLSAVLIFVLYNRHNISQEHPTSLVRQATAEIVVADAPKGNTLTSEDAGVESEAAQMATVVKQQPQEVTHLTGSVGKLAATFSLIWKDDGSVSGTYYNDKSPAQQYQLKGREATPGRLELEEYTGETKTANCTLRIQAGCYDGIMENTDGRSSPMRMCLD